MRVVIQRVSRASVSINNVVRSGIGKGLLILLGITDEDNEEDIEWLTRKIARLRVFNDEFGVMNVSAMDCSSEFLVISQFTLYASTKKGNRPSYIRAAGPEIAVPLYESFVKKLRQTSSRPVQTGTFGADMQVELLNDGPVTIIIDSRQRDL